MQESETGALTQSYTYDARGNRATMTVTGTESYAVSYAYDANNRLLTEQKTQGLLTDLTTYIYDANGNLLSKTVLAGNGGAAGSTYVYNTLNQLVSATENQRTAAYAYNTQGIRTTKVTFSTRTNYLLDGANVVGERLNGEYVSYLRGANLISRTSEDGTDFYLFNAHGDVTGLVSDSGTVTHKYDYDAFGVEKDPDPLDENPFRYCGEYFDRETETYYLRARYYEPTIGRFTQQDTHWTTANSIYGDNPQKINEREDKLGLKSYSYAPQITAVMQSGNLYVYGVSNPAVYIDSDGNQATRAEIHNWVVYDIVDKYALELSMIANVYIKYKDSGYGYADLVSTKTGEIWEVKRLSLSKKVAKRQLAQYVSGKVKKDSYKIDTLHVGGEMGSKIDPQVIIRESGNTIYCIAYFDAGDGIIYYDYIAQEKKTAEEVLDDIAKAILIAGLLGLLIETGGAALPAIPAILELAW